MKEIKFYLNFIFSVAKKNCIFVILKVLLALIGGFFPVFSAVMPKYILDAIVVRQSIYYFLLYVVFFVIMQTILSLIYAVIELFSNKLLQQANLLITSEALDRMFIMQYDYYDDVETANIFQRAFGFATGVGLRVFDTFLNVVSTTITIISYIYIVAQFNYLVLLAISASVIVNYVLMIKKAKCDVEYNNQTTLMRRKINYFQGLLLNKQQARDIRLNGTYPILKYTFTDISKSFITSTFKNNLRLFYYTQAGNVLQNSVTLGIMILFGYMLLSGEMTIGDYTVTLNTSLQFSGVLFSMIKLVASLYGGVLESKNYEKFKQITESNISTQKLRDDKINCISLKEVSYRYYGTDGFALSKITFDFLLGKTYAIIGENGSGKSTLIKLILGLYRPTEGQILVNDHLLSEINLIDYYSKVSSILQDFQFIDGMSIKNNLLIENEDDMKEYLNLTRVFNLDRFNEIQNDYSKTFVATGLECSGGEKQKLANIRAALNLKDKRIVVMDEPTSAIDSASGESIIQHMCEKNSNDRIIIFVTHNHELTKFADVVLRFQKGQLIEIVENK